MIPQRSLLEAFEGNNMQISGGGTDTPTIKVKKGVDDWCGTQRW
jgi:hypothetical protein